MQRTIFIGLIIIIFFSSCKKSISRLIIKECSSQTSKSEFVLGKITDFPWDKLYIFGQFTTSGEISKALNFQYSGTIVSEHEKRMVFTFQNKVSYEENFSFKNECKSQIFFVPLLTDTAKDYISYKKSNAIFFVKKEKQDCCKDCFYYSLIPLKNR